MSKTELVEWTVMILIIVLWWPVVFMAWGPAWYQYPLSVVSFGALLVIFRNRLRRLNQGFQVSEEMMEARHKAEEMARGGRPSLDEKEAPDVSEQLPFMPPPVPPDDERRNGNN